MQQTKKGRLADEYLTAKYDEKDRVKALGAKFDRIKMQWYVPDGLDLNPFLAWLPAARKMQLATVTNASAVSFPTAHSNPVAVLKKEISLSQLLNGVSQAITKAYGAGVWTMVEVVNVRPSQNGTVYLEISERDANGRVVAKSGAVIWSNNASRILSEFQKTTGAVAGPGVKLLVRAKPVFKSAHGFGIEIDAIDPQYTLGDLEGRKRDIHARLHREGVFNANREITTPWDFAAVLVVAPPDAAGLGDFRAEADRLERYGICRFMYVHSRFQGEGAAAEIRQALINALEKWGSMPKILPHAVVIIRGGGAVNDLAWLNDYDLARCICDLEIPVFTGIGHERDSTVLDKVAHSKFDTPSKVIAGIERIIRMRAQESKENFEQIARMAGLAATTARRAVVQSDAAIKSSAGRLLVLARQQSSVLMAQLQRESARTVRVAAESAQGMVIEVRQEALKRLSSVRHTVPALMADVTTGARQAVRAAKTESRARFVAVTDRANDDSKRRRESIDQTIRDLGANARKSSAEAAGRSRALIREITGQGPEKTLARGFAIVRSADGATVTSANVVVPSTAIQIEFQDGLLVAKTVD